MLANFQGPPLNGYGPAQAAAFARFSSTAVNGSQTLVDAFGIKTVTRTGTGLWTVTLSEKLPAFSVIVNAVAAAHADFHDCHIYGVDFSAGTFSFAHYRQNARTGAHALEDGIAVAASYQVYVFGRWL